jgi:lipoprotein-releasing system ATP-binding protein
MTQVLLEAKQIRKVFFSSSAPSLEILKDVSLTLHRGESVAIMGKSGSGKSSLLHILGTLDIPTSGSVWIEQQDAFLHKEKIRKEKLGFVFQSFHLLEDLSLLENVLMPARIYRASSRDLIDPVKKALDLLEFVGLKEKARLPAKLLSGGEKQRASIARAFCNNPDLLLVDEPTGNLDPMNAKLIQTLLLQGCKEKQKSLLLVTHDEEFASLCDKVYHLKEGVLLPCS